MLETIEYIYGLIKIIDLIYEFKKSIFVTNLIQKKGAYDGRIKHSRS
jgi:hypothetical protein